MSSPVRKVSKEAVRKLIERYCKKADCSVLDVGCGSGRDSEVFEGAGVTGEYLGIDLKERSEWGDYEKDTGGLATRFEVIDIAEIGRWRRKFDFVYSFYSFEHMEDDKEASRMIEAVLDEDGYALIVVPSNWSKLLYIRHYNRMYNIKSMEELIRDTRLRIVEVVRLGGLGTFIEHLLIMTLMDGVLRKTIRRKIHKLIRVETLIDKMDGFIKMIDRIFPIMESGYAIMLRKVKVA